MKAGITLLYTLLLPDFPSASAVEYLNGRLYLIGDDATCILVLDRNYQVIKSVPVADAPGKRIAKAEKPDYEASALITLHGQAYLLASGSLATEKRRQLLLLPLPGGVEEEATTGTQVLNAQAVNNIQRINYQDAFISQLITSGISELNIEGATVIGNTLLLSNRGNESYPVNQLILVPNGFWEQEVVPAFSVLPLTLLTPTPVFAGVSDLCYVPDKDLLLCTLSSEATTNAYDDGAIGDSYIGWIADISQKLIHTSVAMDGWLNLAEADPVFKTEKIEGICVEQIMEEELILHLVSDNDGGESRLFKVAFSLEA
ncbi:DUF6929 family protein [Chitinophaga sp. RAB17]|uniref:DUF6929 family protein n=1 Tax=Chitinophaga sp. RAB17 TaxID=3233049 RepID=UPI003F8DC557